MTRWAGFGAALMGAAGVALAALGAHAGLPRAATASQMLLLHAAALLALLALGRKGAMRPGIGRLAVLALLAGVMLFAGDLLLRDLGWRFPGGFAAPAGGVLMIGGWLLAGVAIITGR
jgi:uncharacterized membrane protein YgdD (TMEM256/DUF423 family)